MILKVAPKRAPSLVRYSLKVAGDLGRLNSETSHQASILLNSTPGFYSTHSMLLTKPLCCKLNLLYRSSVLNKEQRARTRAWTSEGGRGREERGREREGEGGEGEKREGGRREGGQAGGRGRREGGRGRREGGKEGEWHLRAWTSYMTTYLPYHIPLLFRDDDSYSNAM